MAITAVESIAGVTASLTSVEGLHTALTAAHNANTLVAEAILPPGNDPSSAIGVTQQLTRLNEFSENMDEALLHIHSWLTTLQETLMETVEVNAEEAAAISMAMDF